MRTARRHQNRVRGQIEAAGFDLPDPPLGVYVRFLEGVSRKPSERNRFSTPHSLIARSGYDFRRLESRKGIV